VVEPAPRPSPTIGETETVDLDPGDNVTNLHAGVFGPATISGNVWLDANDNGLKDSGEDRGVADVEVALIAPADDGRDPADDREAFRVDGETEALHRTGADGDHSLEELRPGSYYVWFSLPNGYRFTTGDDSVVDSSELTDGFQRGSTGHFDLESGQTETGWDAGAFKLASISGVVWLDDNVDGVRDPDRAVDPGLAGARVSLVDSTGAVVQGRTETTGDDGEYEFGNLDVNQRATYRVKFTLPEGHRFTKKPATGANSVVASTDMDESGRTATVEVVLDPGEDDEDFDAGAYKVAGAEIRVDPTAPIDPAGGPRLDQKCSLLEAIKAANDNSPVDTCTAGKANPKVDQIVFIAPGPPTGITAPTDGFLITSDMKVEGHAGGTTINGGGGFKVVLGAAEPRATDVALSHMTVTGVSGAGVRVEDNADASVTDKVNVALKNMGLSSNEVGAHFHGAFQSGRTGEVRVEDSVISGNSAWGAKVDACQPGQPGAGVTFSVVGSVVRGNGAEDDDSGGIENVCGDLRVVDSAVTRSTGEAAGIHAEAGRAEGSQRASNRVEVVNSTVAGNTGDNMAGIKSYTQQGFTPVLTIRHSTIADNGGGGVRTERTGNQGDLDVTISNSVVAGNTGAQCSFASALPAVPQPPAAPPERNRGNASSDRSCGFGIVSDDIDLKPLADSGGARPIGPHGGSGNVLTMAFGGGSPLFDRANAAACRGVPKAGESKDARGVTRLQPTGAGCDIGAYEAHVISGTVYDDANANRRQDKPGEAGIAGVKVHLVKPAAAPGGDETVVTTAATNDDGEYRLPVAPGTWTVRVATPDADTNTVLADYRATRTDPVPEVPVRTTDTAEAAGGDFGYRRLATVTGKVWVDVNGDGLKADEDGLAEVTVRLYGPKGQGESWPSASIRDHDTLDAGTYTFGRLEPGTYQVRFTLPDGHRFTKKLATGGDSDVDDVSAAEPWKGTATVNLTAGGTAPPPEVDAGAYVPVSISGMVWEDQNADGVRDETVDSGGQAVDRGLVGADVQLLKSGTPHGQSKRTPDAGTYSFTGLPPGDYQVQFTLPEGYLFTKKLATGGHSDVAPPPSGRTATTAEINLVSGAPETVRRAGAYQLLITIGDLVWEDRDGNGAQDDGEPGIERVTLVLVDSGGDEQGAATTNEHGIYSFRVKAGRWTVRVTDTNRVLAGLQPPAKTSKTAGVSVVGGDNLAFDFGYRPSATPPPPPPPEPLLLLVKSASGKAPAGAGDNVSYSFLVTNGGNVTLTGVSVDDPKTGKVACPQTTLAPGKATTCTASYEASAADAAAGKVVNTATATATAPDGAKVSAVDSVTFDLKEGKMTVGRLAGTVRYATAVEISKATFAPGVDVVYVATGVNFPDALAGSAASGGKGPILLVTKDAIPGATLAELKRLKPKRIVVLGGTGVVSTSVEAALRKQAETTRQAGADRYSTAAAISAEHFGPGAAVVFVATGADFPDALTGGPAAAKAGGPILLTQKDKLPSATVSELKRLKPKKIIVLGGTGVVSDAVEKALASYTSGKVSRLAGTDRYSTGGAISKDGFDQGAPVVYVATGLNFPDALAGGAAGAFKDGPVLLVSGGSIPKATKAELTRLKPKRIIVLGGTAVVPESVEKALAAYLR